MVHVGDCRVVAPGDGRCEKPESPDREIPAFSCRVEPYLLILAHESLSVTVRLKTGCSGVESVSGQK